MIQKFNQSRLFRYLTEDKLEYNGFLLAGEIFDREKPDTVAMPL